MQIKQFKAEILAVLRKIHNQTRSDLSGEATVCMVLIPNVVMAKFLAHVSITHDNNNCFGSLYQYFSFGSEMVGRF